MKTLLHIAIGMLWWVLVSGGAFAAAPALSDYQQSNWTDQTNTNEVTASITWSAGDFMVVLGGTADNPITLSTPTVTGLTFSAVSGTPTNTTNKSKAYAWTATAGSSGSGTITVVAAP